MCEKRNWEGGLIIEISAEEVREINEGHEMFENSRTEEI